MLHRVQTSVIERGNGSPFALVHSVLGAELGETLLLTLAKSEVKRQTTISICNPLPTSKT